MVESPAASLNPKRPNNSVSVVMKIEIDDLLVTKIRNGSDCYGMSKDEVKEYLNELIDELLREHVSKESLREEIGEDDED